MKWHAAWLSLVLAGVVAGTAPAQRTGSTVQLPTFSFFSVGTTVSVPDRGSVYMGGINRAATGRNEFGTPLLPFRPFRSTAIGTERSASSMRMSVYVHDLAAMDEELLSRPTSYRPGPLTTLQPRGGSIAGLGNTLQPRNTTHGGAWQPSSSASPTRPAVSVAEVRAQRVGQQATRADEATGFFDRGRKAEEAGKANVAKIYYQMAARRATESLKSQVLARLDAIGRAQTASKIARDGP